jgi:hypothetical protein
MDWNGFFSALYDKPESWRYRLVITRCRGGWAEAELLFMTAKGSYNILCDIKAPVDLVLAVLIAAIQKHESPGPYKP